MTEQAITPIRWGILGTGKIAHKFAHDVTVGVPDAIVQAVGSRTQASAEAFGDEFAIPNRHGSYEDLANDPEVDAIYVSTPHPWHHDATILSLRGGKAVLCEKAFAMNAREAREMVAVAQEENRFLMEAMWLRFRPAMVKLRALIAEGAIGEVVNVHATISWAAAKDHTSRLFAKELGGGALLDATIYPISFAFNILGTPTSVTGVATIGETGVDEQEAIAFGYASGAVASIIASFYAPAQNMAIVTGTKGRLEIAARFWEARTLTFIPNDGREPEVFDFPEHDTTGYQYEAIAVGEAIRQGEIEHPLMPHAETIAIMETIDQLRAQWGVTYDADQQGV